MTKRVVNDLNAFVNNYLNNKNDKSFNKLLNEALSFSDLYLDDFDNYERGLEYLNYTYKMVKTDLIINENTISKLIRFYLNLADFYQHLYLDDKNEKILMELVNILEEYDLFCKNNNIINKHYKTYKKILTELVDFLDEDYITSSQKKYLKKYYNTLTNKVNKMDRARANYLMALCYNKEKYKILAIGLAREISDYYYDNMSHNFFVHHFYDHLSDEDDIIEQEDIWLKKYNKIKNEL